MLPKMNANKNQIFSLLNLVHRSIYHKYTVIKTSNKQTNQEDLFIVQSLKLFLFQKSDTQ
jgi:hypothetical protein